MKPAWAIRANGKDVTATFKPHLLAIRVRDESKDEADSVTITLDNSGSALEAVNQGDQLEILLGYEGNLLSLGSFVVDECVTSGPPDMMTVTCKSAAFAGGVGITQSFMTSKTRSWEPSTIGAIANKIAAEHGVELVVPPSVNLLITPHLNQTEMNDSLFLYDLVEPRGYIIKLADNKLIIAPKSAGVTANIKTGQAVPAVTLGRGDVSSYSGKWSQRSVFTKAVAYWHNPATGQTVYEEAGTGDRVYRTKNIAPDQKTAQEWAKANVKNFASKGGTLSMTMPGRVDLQSEQLITCVGFPYPLSVSPAQGVVAKQWILKSVEHTLSSGGFTTSITGEPFTEQ